MIKLVSIAGERVVSIEDFFSAPGSTILKAEELLTEIRVPAPPAYSAGVSTQYPTARGEEPALVAVAVLLNLDPGNRACTEAGVVCGAVAPTPLRALRAEAVLRGEKINIELARKAAQAAADESSPIDDIRGSAEYRREMLKVVTRDAVMRAAELAELTI
jgi:carbon-monoxide dehydrogenase medium subunit